MSFSVLQSFTNFNPKTQGCMFFGGFLKWWVSPTNPWVFLLKMIIFFFWGVPPFKGNTHINCIDNWIYILCGDLCMVRRYTGTPQKHMFFSAFLEADWKSEEWRYWKKHMTCCALAFEHWFFTSLRDALRFDHFRQLSQSTTFSEIGPSQIVPGSYQLQIL